jgi:hypothetical protein
MTAEDQRIHKADCDVWDLPPTKTQKRLHPEMGRDPATDRYLARIAPAYDGLGRVMAQLSGIFLLALTRDGTGPDLHLDHSMYTIALDQLAEAREIIGGAVAPAPALRHRAGLVDLADRLADVAAGMDRMAGRGHVSDRDFDRTNVLKRLAAAQRLLIATAAPGAGITPVDFNHACCNCTTTREIR